ncbi:RnfABCDGE type electron transport complex subunit D [Crateriforma conspicua]|uniref:Ion-translocating oxidoreductase complex subunit D n=1 Tax=Crateriforma conspicua TaxID=2527996 RepID=A0A5C5Y347_9PLAN|nr:RnfABCDGE type electron transport complex subunit D [Crateriforma conspicua]TWT69111.1 Electron transport complex protein RnfD [Crateriforma conspicua]
MNSLAKTLTIRSSPHIAAVAGVDTIMFNVVMALMPVSLYAVYAFGLSALLVMVTAVLSCVLTEHLLCRVSGRVTTVGDWSAVITGLLYGLTLPPSLPLWMVVAGGVIAIGLGKFLFGGLGGNPFNPALVGRAILQAAFPAAMTTWPVYEDRPFAALPTSTLTLPMTVPQYDGMTAPTPLSDWKFNQVAASTGDLFLGATAGSTGETCALLILIGGVYLAARNMMSWRIPVGVIGTVAILSFVLNLWNPDKYAGPWFMVFSGGLMLGAVFMATDMVASPMTHLGGLVYGAIIGLLVVLIRVWGGMPEGVMYAILIGNALSPHIDSLIQPTVYGTAKGRKKELAKGGAK